MTNRSRCRAGAALAALLLGGASGGFGQATNFSLGIAKVGNTAVVSWNGLGSLQSFSALPPSWIDLLEAASPLSTPLTNAHQFFRVVSHWGTRSNLLEANSEMAVAELGGKIYVVGGRLGAGFTSPMTNVLEVYDPVAGTWSTRAPMPTIRGGINGMVVGDRFFVWGGESPNGMFAQHEVYAAELDRWYRLEPMRVPVLGVTGAAFVDGWSHMPGGGTATGGSSGSTIHQVFWVGGIVPLVE